MSARSAAQKVLERASEPLSSEEIYVRIKKSGLWKSSGATPAATIGAVIYSHIKRHGKNSPFTSPEAGKFWIRKSKGASKMRKTYSKHKSNQSARNLTYLDAAEKVLKKFGKAKPMHYRDITELAIKKGYLRYSKQNPKTPWLTMGAKLSVEIKKRTSKFYRVLSDSGIYGLTEYKTKNKSLSFLEAAEQVLRKFGKKKPMHYRDITDHAINENILKTEGKTASITMRTRLSSETQNQKSKGKSSRFYKSDRAGFYGLTEFKPKNIKRNQTTIIDDSYWTIEKLLLSINVNKFEPRIFFLGAGASVQSGIPSAEDCIWDWKKEIYKAHHSNMNLSLDLSNPSDRRKIQKWIDKNIRDPKRDEYTEYSDIIQECYPDREDRERYFTNRMAKANKPSKGYIKLCKLFKKGFVDSIWSTNFDNLAVNAAIKNNIVPFEIGIDTASKRFDMKRDKNMLLTVSMHGDFRYDSIKNTSKEVINCEKNIIEYFKKTLCEKPLIVVGYRGRDESIMNALEEVYSKQVNGFIIWCGYKDKKPPKNVKKLLDTAIKAGNRAKYVPTDGFDELIGRITDHCF